MDVLVAAGDPALQREVAAGLHRTGFGVVEVRRPGLVACGPDDAPLPPGALGAAVVGHGFGFDGLAFGAFLRERHPCLGVWSTSSAIPGCPGGRAPWTTAASGLC